MQIFSSGGAYFHCTDLSSLGHVSQISKFARKLTQTLIGCREHTSMVEYSHTHMYKVAHARRARITRGKRTEERRNSR